MHELAFDRIQSALRAQPLFEAKSWQLSPAAWPLTAKQVEELEAIGSACLEFQQALETLYLRSVAGRNLLRTRLLWRRGSPTTWTAGSRGSWWSMPAIRGTAAFSRRSSGRTFS